MVENEIQETVGIVAAVSNDVVADTISQQCLRLRDIVSVTTGQENVKRIAQGVYDYMNLGAESASTAPERLRLLAALFLGAPAAQGCARTTVLSGITLSISASSLK